MRKRLVLLSMLPVVIGCSDACAEALNEEVVRHPSLLMLGEVGQAVGFGYGYSAHSTGGRSTSSQSMSESYSVATEAAVLDPEILYLKLNGGLSFQQQMGNSEAKLMNWNYDILGSAFQFSYHPVTISTNRTSSTISNGYIPTYTLDRTNYQMNVSLLNDILPVRFFYYHSATQTHGLPLDSAGSTDSAGLSVNHNYRDRVNTDASVNFSTSDAAGQESRSYSLYLLNRVDLDQEKRYQLVTKGSFSERVSGDVPQQQADLGATLSGRLGLALTGTVGAQSSYSSLVDFEGEKQVIKTNSFSGGVTHRLYQSLNTSLSGSLAQTDALGGTESSYTTNAVVTYQKRLPAESLLTVTANLGRTVTDQEFADISLFAFREEHQVTVQGEIITPKLSGRLIPESVQVMSVVAGDVEHTYVRDVDFRVNEATNKIETIVNGDIARSGPVVLLITYKVAVNQNLDFQTDTQSYLFALSLLGGRYSVSGDYSNSKQRRISGKDDSIALVDSTSANLRGIAHYPAHEVGAEVGTVSSTQESLTRMAAFWTHDTHIFSNDTARIAMRDVFTMYDASATSRAYDENLATLSVSYNRSIFSGIRLVLSANLNDSRRGSESSNMAAGRVGLDGSFNRMTVSLAAQSSYRIVAGPNSQDVSCQLRITRYF